MRRDNKEIRGESFYPMIEDLKTTITGKFITQLKEQGITTSNIHRNLPVKLLVDIILEKNEGILTSNGSLSVRTGKYTGRSPDDRYIVDDSETHANVDWGKVNHPFPEAPSSSSIIKGGALGLASTSLRHTTDLR